MFIPRHPVVENQFCQFNETDETGGVGGVLAYAGSVCYLVDAATNQDAIVNIYGAAAPTDTGGQRDPFGFLMQKVKTGYHSVHPTGFMMPGDLGSSDVIAQPKYNSSTGAINGSKDAPVGVAHLGIWDTIHYTVSGTTNLHPGVELGIAPGAGSLGGKVIHYADRMMGIDTYVAKVVKGASTGQVAANVANTTLYPIRIKLLI